MRGRRAPRRSARTPALLLLLWPCLALSAQGAQEFPAAQSDLPAPLPGSVTTTPSELVLLPAVPGSKALRLRVESETLPGAGLEDHGAVDRWRLGLRARVGLPASRRLTLQATGRYATTHYDFDGVNDFWSGRRARSSNPFSEFHELSASLQSAFALNPLGHVFYPDEEWSLLGEVFGASRWEGDAFSGGLLGGGGLAIGYEFPGRLRLALGVSLRSKVADNSIGVNPVFSLRWRVTKKLTLSTRGRGAQLEYEWSRRFRSYASVFRSGQSWRLEKRRGVPGSTIFSDQQLRCGVGFEWRPLSQLRLHLEVGAIASRSLEVEVGARGSRSEIDGSPSAYLVLAFELTP